MAAKKKIATSVLKHLEAEHDKLVKQRDRLRAEMARSKERQTRTLGMLSQFPEVVEALNVGLRPAYMDAETWADLQAFRGEATMTLEAFVERPLGVAGRLAQGERSR